MEKIESIDIKKIHDFPNHPFKIIEDQNYKELKESIINNGVLIPVILRKKNDNEYEMIAKKSWKIVKTMSDEEIDEVITHIPMIYGKLQYTKFKNNRKKK